MAGGRTPGPQGLYGARPHHPGGVVAGFSEANPLGVAEVESPADAPFDAVTGLATGVLFWIGSRQYRIVEAGTSARADEERLDAKQSAELLREAVKVTPAVALLQQSGRPFVVMRIRPQAPGAATSQAAPPPPPGPPPPARKPAPAKEGWIEIEVLDDAGEPVEGERYKLKLPDGRVLEGTIGSKGLISVHGIDPGSAELTITSLDGAVWSA